MKDRSRPIASGRLSRLAAFGQMAGGVASGMVAEGARCLARGERPQLADLFLTPANARRVTEQLSRLRGAAILGQLRDSAHHMPPAQLQRNGGRTGGVTLPVSRPARLRPHRSAKCTAHGLPMGGSLQSRCNIPALPKA